MDKHHYYYKLFRIECDWCGKRYSEKLRKCPHCGAANIDHISLLHERKAEKEDIREAIGSSLFPVCPPNQSL